MNVFSLLLRILPCLRKGLPCPFQPRYTSLFLNCGGPRIVVGGQEYDDDSSQIGTSTFHADRSGRWAYSSTGDFIANEDANYIVTNTSTLNMTYPDLYRDARLAPISLKYYGLCLLNGDYLVSLHFAEIMYTADETYSSLGRRLFDVLIQGERVLKDFNIEDAAGGPGRAIVMNFTILVTSNTLEIHLYWAGKGTNAIPERGGVYGPLISAISVTRTSKSGVDQNGISIGAILGIVGLCFFLFIVISLYLWFNGCCRKLRGGKKTRHAHGFQCGQKYYFSIEQIEVATNGFDPANKIGQGGFGTVYKGLLEDGTLVAVKQLSSHSSQGNREFLNEIGMISALQHPNLVKLFGCCVEGNQLLLIYEYMENNSLGRALFGHEEHRLKLDWSTRCAICLGVAKGLAYLHEESRLRIVHRDIKATNILLDKNLNPKISDFGLAKLYEKENTHISTRVAGTVGYMAPEYATRGYLTDKADVYSFGVVVLEVVTGKSNTNYVPDEKFLHLLDWAFLLLDEGRLIELVDLKLNLDYSEEEALRLLNVALLCTNPSPTQRPAMSAVVSMLTEQTPVPTPVKHVNGNEDWIVGALRKLSSDSRPQSTRMHNSPMDSVISLHEDEKVALYPSTSVSLTDVSGVQLNRMSI
uniref:non-specific serine/threonine protein kinase n=1 Tax=Anthurium amnicola TaxID=1678845 RepID=A0A1D1XML0_9ARAE